MQIKVGMRVKLKEPLNKRMQGVPLIISEIKKDFLLKDKIKIKVEIESVE